MSTTVTAQPPTLQRWWGGPRGMNLAKLQPPVRQPAKSLSDLKRTVHNKLVDKLDFDKVKDIYDEGFQREVRLMVERLCDGESPLLAPAERDQVVGEILDETFGLGPLEALLNDPTITDILVNGPDMVYVERQGTLHKTDVRFRDNNHLLQIIDRIVSRVQRRVDETTPMVDARLPDGSRVNAIIPPLAIRGASLSIRRFGSEPLQLEQLLAFHSLTPEMAAVLKACIKGRLNILVSGGTGSGKTTLLNVLSSMIPATDRLVTIEDAVELQLQQEHVVQLETRPANIEGRGAITIRDLLRNALRMRPERIIIGECRGPEVLDMLQAMNTGHAGSMTTLHANSPRDALGRLEMMVMMCGVELPLKALRQQIASAINLVVQVDRLAGGARKIINISEVVGMEQDMIMMQEIFRYRKVGNNAEGRTVGQFETTGVRPRFLESLQGCGIQLPANLFQQRVLLQD